MKPFTLVVDGNHFLHQTYSIAKHIEKRSRPGSALDFYQSPENDRRALLWKMSLDFASVVKRFGGCIDSIVYCIDSSSWRKEYQTSDVKYKANREEKKEEINWQEVFRTHDLFVEGLKNEGITISRVPGCEGDDLIYGWTNYLNMNSRNAIIMSGDNDLIQLVNYTSSNDTVTVFYNKFTDKLYTFQEFGKWLDMQKKKEEDGDDVSIFDVSPNEINKDVINTFEKALKNVEKVDVDPVNFIISKIIEGDKKDNVTSVYQYQKENKNGKLITYAVSGKKVEKILEAFRKKWGRSIDLSDMFDDESLGFICKQVKNVMGIGSSPSLDELVSKLKDNRNLILLHIKCIPDAIINAMYDNIEERDIGISGSTIKRLNDKNNIMETLGYDSSDSGTSSADIFNGVV